MSSSYYLPPEALFSGDPSQWVAQPGCECSAAGVGIVHDVDKAPLVYAAGDGGALPGLTPEETAILAGVLTALATFLFLLIPILCCLCPMCAGCCSGGRKKMAAVSGGHRHANIARSDNGSFWSTGSFGKAERVDYDNLYGVDMKLPRPWVDGGSHFESRVQELEDGGWEGVDMSRDEIDAAVRAGGNEEMVAQSGMLTYAGAEHSGSALGGAHSTLDRGHGGGDEVVTEYTTTRRVDMHIGGMTQDEAEGYYAQTYGGHAEPEMSKDNFMRIYHSYRNDLDRSYQ